MKQSLLIPILTLFAMTAGAQQRPPKKVFLPAELQEISGMARTPDGAFWALADGENPAVLYRIDPFHGRILEQRPLPLPNRDWEDLCADPAGNLYIGDFGNNLSTRKDLAVFIYTPQSGKLDSIRFHYPEQSNFKPQNERDMRYDCEAMVWRQDALWLFTKSRFKGDGYTRLYKLPAVPGNYAAVLTDSFYLKNSVVSGAALSKDGSTLALCGYFIGRYFNFLPFTRAHAHVFRAWPEGRILQGQYQRKRLPKCLIARQYESMVHIGGRYWIAANEGNRLQKTSLRRVKLR